jgi:hypothetical protein
MTNLGRKWHKNIFDPSKLSFLILNIMHATQSTAILKKNAIATSTIHYYDIQQLYIHVYDATIYMVATGQIHNRKIKIKPPLHSIIFVTTLR